MAGSGFFTFTDPQSYQAAVSPAQVEILVTAKGNFRADLMRLQFPRLWVQSGRENLPRVAHSAVSVDRPPFFFLTGADQPTVHHSGIDVSFGEIIAVGAGSTHHVHSNGHSHWATLSMTREDLSAAGYALVGRDLTAPSVTRRLRPTPPMMSRLRNLHRAAGQLAKTEAHSLSQTEPARALELALMHVMINCLCDGAPVDKGTSTNRHLAVIARFEELLAMNHDRPLYLAEICAATGVSERTLRVCCQEHLGMGPVRYLWLRRMHLVRRALILATPETATVTEIAMNHGFWELGRFAVRYQALFGERPSTSLRRPSEGWRTSRDSPLAFADSESA
jgi:AraC-like DNA-binding protein